MLGVGASLALAAVVAGADQAAKRGAVARLAVGQARPLVGPARLRLVVNRRGGLVALGLPWAGALWALVSVAALWGATRPEIGPSAVAGTGLVVGGAASNLADRSTRGGVVDLLAVGGWPTFNLADVAIVAGAGLCLVAVAAGG